MVKVVVDDSEHTIIEIIHVIPESDLETINLPREMIVDAEIKEMEEELKEDYPSFHLVFSYPQRKIMAEPKDETYKKAINKIEDFGGIRGLKVTTRGVKYYTE